jgi:flagellar biosynthesis protein FlhA
MYVKRPLDFAIFPALLLVATMFRLALNVSSTRLVLLDGYAGKVVEAFGLVRHGRLARRRHGHLPDPRRHPVHGHHQRRDPRRRGRAPLHPRRDARQADGHRRRPQLRPDRRGHRPQRRADVSAEADFYGAMDGASKFVKGDAMAGIIITLINLLGGFAIGVVQRGMPLARRDDVQPADRRRRAGLAGPGTADLVASGLIVTRSATDGDMGSDIIGQFSRQRLAVRVGGVAVIAIGLVPGLPFVPFVVVGGALLVVGMRLPDPDAVAADTAPALPEGPAPDSAEQLALDMRVEPLELEVAYDLVELVDPASGGDLLDRVKSLRRKMALDLGIVLPLVRTRDNLDLPPHSLRGAGPRRRGRPGRGPERRGAGHRRRPRRAAGVDDPRAGLRPARPSGCPAELQQQAELMGCTVVDRASVITTHLAEVVRTYASRCSAARTSRSSSTWSARSPTVVEELTPRS